MTIDNETLATLGFAFSRNMYYAKMIEGMIDASIDYHKKLIDETYSEIYGKYDNAIYRYIYKFNNAYDELLSKFDKLDKRIIDINNEINNISFKYSNYNNLVTLEDYDLLANSFINRLKTVYNQLSIDKFYTELNEIPEHLLENHLYKHNGKYFICINGSIEYLDSFNDKYRTSNKLINQLNSLYTIYENINEKINTYQSRFNFNDESIELVGYNINIDSTTFRLNFNEYDIHNEVDINSIYLKGKDYPNITITYKDFEIDYLLDNGLTKVISLDNLNNGTIIKDLYIDNKSVKLILENNLKSEYISLDSVNRVVKRPNEIFTDNYIKDINTSSKVINNSINYSDFKYSLFDWYNYTTKANVEYLFDIYLPSEDSTSYANIKNTNYNVDVDSLPYKFEYIETDWVDNFYESIKDYVTNDNFKELFYIDGIHNYRYYRDKENYLDFKIKLNNKYYLTKLDKYEFEKYLITLNLTNDLIENGIHSISNNKIIFRDPKINKNIIGKYITNIRNLELVYNSIDNIYSNNDLDITNDAKYIGDNTVEIQRSEIDYSNITIEYSDESTDNIQLNIVDDYVEHKIFKLSNGIDIYNIQYKNNLQNLLDYNIFIGNNENYSRNVDGDRIINSFFDESVSYNRLHSNYVVNNYIQTVNDNLYKVTLLDTIVNYKRMKLSQKLIANYDEYNKLYYIEKLVFNDNVDSYELSRIIYPEIDSLIFSSNINNNIIKYNLTYNNKTININENIVYDNIKLDSCEIYNSPYYTTLIIKYSNESMDILKFSSNYAVIRNKENNIKLDIDKNNPDTVEFNIIKIDSINDKQSTIAEKSSFVELDNKIDEFLSYSYVEFTDNITEPDPLHIKDIVLVDEWNKNNPDLKITCDDETVVFYESGIIDEESCLTFEGKDNKTNKDYYRYIDKDEQVFIYSENNRKLTHIGSEEDSSGLSYNDITDYSECVECLKKSYNGTYIPESLMVSDELFNPQIQEEILLNIPDIIQGQEIISGIKQELKLKSGKSTLLKFQNNNKGKLRLLVSLQNAEFDEDRTIPVQFMVIDEKSDPDISKNQLNILSDNDVSSYCTIISLDY